MIKNLNEMRERVLALHNEIDCRVSHGAESGGHLEFVKAQLGKILADSADPYPNLPSLDDITLPTGCGTHTDHED
jgi:hypothetical protein